MPLENTMVMPWREIVTNIGVNEDQSHSDTKNRGASGVTWCGGSLGLKGRET